MSVDLLFGLAFAVAAPFWALMIVLPRWRVARRVVASPWIVAPVLLVWVVAVWPVFGGFLALVTAPTLDAMTAFLGSPNAVVALWAQIIAWDLFIGRWVYLDSREQSLRALPMAPILVLLVLVSPIALPLYLVLRNLQALRLPS